MYAIELKNKILPGVFEKNITQKLITYSKRKKLPVFYKPNILKSPAGKPRPQFTSLGIVIPFQPCMRDERSIESVWNNTMQLVETKLQKRYSNKCTGKVLARLKQLFSRLNFNTHRKTLVITLNPGEEKLIYLSFPVKPTVISGRSVSLLDLVTNIQPKADFYCLVLNKNSACLYEYYSNRLKKVYEQRDLPNTDHVYKNAFCAIELLNSKNEKPVFVTGSPGLVAGFGNSTYYPGLCFTFLYNAAPFGKEITESFVKEIARHWGRWQSEFIAGRILLAQKTNAVITSTEAVLQALRNSADGLLLMDKRVKHQLKKPAATGNVIFQTADDLILQIEKFLARGNRIEITETGLLKNMGGLVLLSNTTSGVLKGNSYKRHNEAGGLLF